MQSLKFYVYIINDAINDKLIAEIWKENRLQREYTISSLTRSAGMSDQKNFAKDIQVKPYSITRFSLR